MAHFCSDYPLSRFFMQQMPSRWTWPMPAPQFDWSRSRMPRQPQPVPPIYQPEVAADAIVWAATHRRREVLVGWPTVAALVGNSLAPGLLDRYLGRTGYDAQQTEEAVTGNRPDNLHAPVPGDHGAHGRFDARARAFSAQWWLSAHRGVVVPAIAAGVGVMLTVRACGSGTQRGADRVRLTHT